MTPEQWRRAKALFHDVLERPEGERETFLERARDEVEVLSEVKRLVQQHAAARTFLETPAAAVDPRLLDAHGGAGGSASAGGLASEDPQAIGPFRILGLVGEGGMGVVYLAEQDSPRRRVAL